MIWPALAFVWGFAEATLFFLVPDMILTVAAMRFGLRPALKLSMWAMAGAVLGGLVMMRWGAMDARGAQAALLHVPALGQDLLARVEGEMMSADWLFALMRGAVTGVPYKIYAVQAGIAAFNPVLFAAVSALARLLRFTAACLLVAALQKLLLRFGIAERWQYAALGLGWVAVYGFYFMLRALAGLAGGF